MSNVAYFEDLGVGSLYRTARRTITETDVVNFAGLSGDFNPLHTDAVFAGSTQFGQRIAHGLLVMGVSSGLINQTGMFAGSALGLLGFEDWRFLGPIYFDDTIHVQAEVIEARMSSKGGRGIVRMRRDVVNQRDEIVQQGIVTVLVSTRDGGGVN